MAKPNIGATAVEISGNSKIGLVSATYVSQSSCHSDCPFKGDNGCYAEYDLVGITTRRLNRSEVTDPEQLAQNEATAIGKLTGRFPLRLHVVGDCQTDSTARTVAAAASSHTAKHQQPVWSYTHAWRSVEHSSWQGVSILASCETTEHVKAAQAKGYAAAMVVPQHDSPNAYVKDGIKILPCPQQTGKSANCEQCKLCMRADFLKSAKLTIAFETHSKGEDKANAALFNILK